MATKPTLNKIGDDPIFNKQIIAQAHEENYSDLLGYAEEIANEVLAHINSLSAHDDFAIENTSLVDALNVRDALTLLKSMIESHIVSLNAHDSDSINNKSSIVGIKLTDAIETLDSLRELHENSEGAHSASNLLNDSSVSGGKVKDALEQLSSQINSVVSGGTNVDPRLSQALVDLLGVTWNNFKDLQDFWQEHNVIFDNRTSTYYKIKEQISAQGKPQLIYEEVL